MTAVGIKRLVLIGIGTFSILLLAAPATAEKAELLGTGHFDVPAWFNRSFLDLPEDAAEAQKNGKRLLLYFGQEGCPYCAELFNNNFSQAHIVEYTRKYFDAIEFNIWGDREVTDFSGNKMTEKEFAAKLKVQFTPTLIFLNEKGGVALRINGYYPPHQFLTALQYAAEKQEYHTTFREYLAKSAPPPAKSKLHAKAFFAKPPYDLSQSPSGKPIAVFFEQKDCAGCDRMHDEILSHPAMRQELKRFYIIQLDRWSATPLITPAGGKTTARRWASELDIAYVPTVVIFDAGKEVIRIDSFIKGFHVQSVFDYVATGAYRNQSLQRFIRERSDRIREQGVAIDIWK